MDDNHKILTLDHITKDFPGTRALDDVTFDLCAGEVHCLVGENGAGKSTLIKILSGAENPDKGEIILYGNSFPNLTTRQAFELSVATIYQEVDLVDTLTVADNIFLGDELRNRYGIIETQQQVRIAGEIMERLNIDVDPSVLVGELSPAQKQTLQIIKALHRDAKILVMDEPTSSLGLEETQALMELVRNLASEGIGVIYISHYLQEVTEIGDRITVLKDGKTVNTYERSHFTVELLIHDMVGRDANLFYHKEAVPVGDVGLRVQNYSRDQLVKDVSFDVRKGEVFGIGGMVGSGRTELVSMIFGADKKDSGELFLEGQRITPRNPKEAIRRGICMISEDRKETGLFLIRPVFENMSIVQNEQNRMFLRLREEFKRVSDMVDKLRIHLATVEQDADSLSGGNQQKTLLGRWLLGDAEVYIFDEPTKGVDIGAKEEIYGIITDLARQGKMVIMVSSDMPELISMSDRIGVMRDGEMVAILPKEEATEQRLISEYLGFSNGEEV